MPGTRKPRSHSERAGWTRHLEGWQPGAVAVFLAGITAALVVPRSTSTMELPIPIAEPRRLADVRREDRRLADIARTEQLPFEVRHLGAAVRAFGKAEHARDDAALGTAKREAGTRLLAAMGVGAEKVAALRAYQLETFLAEVRAFVATGRESEELHALGGAFAESPWIRDVGGRRELLIEDAALRALFKKRWNDLVGFDKTTLAPTIDEWRAFYLALLRFPHPEGESYRLRKLKELAEHDPGYPIDLARGVVLYRLGQYETSAIAFRKHLEAHPNGPFTLRATNYLRTALERAPEVH